MGTKSKWKCGPYFKLIKPIINTYNMKVIMLTEHGREANDFFEYQSI